MFVATPRTLNSATARLARATASGKVRPRHVSLTRRESKCGDTSAPTYVQPSRPHAVAARGTVSRHPAGIRSEVVRRVLRRDPALQGRARHLDAGLGDAEVGQCGARRHLELGLHDVDGRYFLGDRVLDLYARVHLDEHVTPVGGDQELDGARVEVTERRGRTSPRPVHNCSLMARSRLGAGAISTTF